MQRVACYRNADRKVLSRSGEVAATLVSAPIQQQLFHCDAPPKLRARLAIGRQQHVRGSHRAGQPNADRFLAKGGRKSPQAAGAL